MEDVIGVGIISLLIATRIQYKISSKLRKIKFQYVIRKLFRKDSLNLHLLVEFTRYN
jgi:hypothetical protein